VEIVVALLFVGVALAIVFVRLAKARRDAAGPDEGAMVEAPPPPPGRAPELVRREGLGARVRALFGREGEDPWPALHDVLLKADVGPKATDALVERVRARWSPGEDPEAILREEIVALLGPDQPLGLPEEGLGVILVVGVNGTGKTTTIGKLARRLAVEGRQVSLAGADTFRAAAGEQLEVWAVRAGAHLVSQERGADPGAVVFDAVTSAKARGSHVLIVDTAGRLHTKVPLMDELRKLVRVVAKAGAQVDETLLVLDATTGQNALAQVKTFQDIAGVTNLVVTKLDGTARGGILAAIAERFGLPISAIGIGEGIDDLKPFDADDFARAIAGLGYENEAAA
jgi:fused signal recognition particle receptor